jgi:nucleotide-binding universal stress UspA family protein
MYHQILVPIDGSDVSNRAVVEASRLAGVLCAQLCLVHVIDLGPLYRAATSGVPIARIAEIVIDHGQQELAAAAVRAQQAGTEPQTTLARGDGQRLSRLILDEAKRWPADLIVMGTHGRGGLERWILGSVAEGVARESPVPVLLVP